MNYNFVSYAPYVVIPLVKSYGPGIVQSISLNVLKKHLTLLAGSSVAGPAVMVIGAGLPYLVDTIKNIADEVFSSDDDGNYFTKLIKALSSAESLSPYQLALYAIGCTPKALRELNFIDVLKVASLDTACQSLGTLTSPYLGNIAYVVAFPSVAPKTSALTSVASRALITTSSLVQQGISSFFYRKTPSDEEKEIEMDDFKAKTRPARIN